MPITKTHFRAFSISCLLACVAGAAATEWITFRSEPGHFTVRYPSTWNRYKDSPDLFEIENFPPSKRLKGVVIPQGGAMIIVLGAPRDTTTIENWIGARGEALSKHEIRTLPQESGACTQLVEVESEGEEGPSTYTHETSFYCSTRTGLYRIELVNWRDDPKQEQLQQIALKMALSLRSW